MAIVEPVTVEDTSPMGGTRTNHNAYGQISASRVSIGGNGLYLYGSDFGHPHAITITIKRSELHRGLSSDRHFAKEELISVTLSETQWATFVSSLNYGEGPCCTIERVAGKAMDELPSPIDRVSQFASEATETLTDAISAIDKSIAALKASGLSQKKIDAIVSEMRMAKQEITSNLSFIEEQMKEAVEESIEKGKQEIHGYMEGMISRAGIASLKGQQILSLGQDSD